MWSTVFFAASLAMLYFLSIGLGIFFARCISNAARFEGHDAFSIVAWGGLIPAILNAVFEIVIATAVFGDGSPGPLQRSPLTIAFFVCVATSLIVPAVYFFCCLFSAFVRSCIKVADVLFGK